MSPTRKEPDEKAADQDKAADSGDVDMSRDDTEVTRDAEDRPDGELPVPGDSDFVPAARDQNEPYLSPDQLAALDDERDDNGRDRPRRDARGNDGKG